jgi:hypothetical protein
MKTKLICAQLQHAQERRPAARSADLRNPRSGVLAGSTLAVASLSRLPGEYYRRS